MQYAERFKALQSILRKASLPLLLVTTPSNILYLTGIHASDAVLLVRHRSAMLFLDARYREAALAQASAGFSIEQRADLLQNVSRCTTCAFEEEHVTIAQMRRWKTVCKNTKFVYTSGLVEGLRRKKDASEIARIKRALSITNDVLERVPTLLKPGITERELAHHLSSACLEQGADGLAFPSIVAFGPSTSEPHHVPGDRKLRRRDIVQIDMGARYRGYCSDRSEVYFVGSPTQEQQRVYDVVLKAKNAAEACVKAGACTVTIDQVARAVLKSDNCEEFFTHALGHGLGIDIHEGVTLSSKSRDVLAPGDVITIEPGVYIPGSFGIRLEHTLFVA